jgi:16S rRNA (cytosine1402-N4)-methyltransferase
MSGHLPVMLHEVLEALKPCDGGRYIDGTLGGGGYTKAILEAADCSVLGIDRDPDAVARGKVLAEQFPGRLIPVRGDFSRMDEILAAQGGDKVTGVVLDLGVSSFQFDEPERGFSFRADGPLDMRMSKDGQSAADFVNTADERTLASIIAEYGEEREARRIARAIVKARPITRTLQLAVLVADVLGPKAKAKAIHPATRTFQALRIYVNDELGELTRALSAASGVLAPGGRLAVVSFHSLEDRIVKRFLSSHCDTAPRASRHAPDAPAARPQFRLLNRQASTPGEAELSVNPRARSAKLRAAERLAA